MAVKGRKPQAIARASDRISDSRVMAMPMPEVVSLVPDARQCWDIIVRGGTFSDSDEVMVTEFCMAYAANRQAWRDMHDDATGALVLTVNTASGDLRKSPSWTIWKESVDIMRHLSGVLGLDPLTKERLNLTKATTSSIAADIPAKVAKAVKAINAQGD